MTMNENRHRVSSLLIGLGVSAWALTVPNFSAHAFQDSQPEEIMDAAEDAANDALDELQDATSQPAMNEPNTTDRARGMAALAKAREHMGAGRYSQAADEYRTALNFMPNNAEAQSGLNAAQANINQASGIDQASQEIDILRQQALADFDAAMQNARQELSNEQFGAAQSMVTTARVELRNKGRFLNPSELESRIAQADTLEAQITEARVLFEQKAIEEQLAEQEEAREREAAEEAARRQEQIDNNLRRVRELQMQRQYDEAMKIIDQILFLEDDNPVALALRDAIQTASLWQNFITGEREREYSFSYQFEENRRAVIAPRPNYGPGPKSTTGIMTYPEDWPNLSIRRTSDAGFVDTDANRRVAAAMDQNIHQIDFDGQTLHNAIAYLRNITGTNIHTDWQALEYIGVTPDDEINLQLRDVPVRTALDQMMKQVGELGGDRPRYAIQDGLLVISSENEIRKHVITLVYDISDLLFDVPYFDNAPSMDLREVINDSNQAVARRNSAFNGLGASRADLGSDESGSFESVNPHLFNSGGVDPDRPSRSTKINKIIDAVQHTVDPDGWRDFGGDTGALQELSGNLIITQTPRNHQQIEGLLSQLREIRALQINIESRFLTVDMNWFEKIGFDLDLYFNTNSDVFQAARAVDPNFHLSDFFDGRGRLKDPVIFDSFSNTNPFANTIGSGYQVGIPSGGPPPTDITYVTGPVGSPIRTTDGFTPFGLSQDSFNLVDVLGGFGADSFGGTILSSNPALSMGIQFLDDVQVDLLIEATQADRRNVVLTAPRLTLFNGQRSWVLVGTQQAFVSSLTPIIGDNSGAFQPITDVLVDGTVLDVEAVISADRRYVTLTVITGIRETVNIDTLTFQGAAGGGGNGGIGGGQANVFQGTISLPEVEVSLINTTTSVPDRGTVLLGGQRLVREVEIETGVPILSKMPVLNRFFTNRITSKDESTLLILIRPEIIIQQENEDLLFPGLSDMLGSP